MSGPFPLVPLSEVLTQYKEYIEAPEPRLYPKLSVKLYGKGVVLDEPANGINLKMKRHQVARAGQVILSEIWGKKGAIGLVPQEGAGALCTSHFFLFDVHRDRIDPCYLEWIFRANYLEGQLGSQAFGTTGYAAVRPKNLLAATIPLPTIEEQHRIVARIEELAARIEEARELRRRATEEARALSKAWVTAAMRRASPDGCLGDVLVGKPRNGWSARCDEAEDGTAVLALSAVTGFRYRGTHFKRTSQPTSPTAHYWLREGDLLITRSNTPELVGHAAIYDGSPSPCIYPDLMMRLSVDESRADRVFVHRWLEGRIAREHIAKVAKGTSPSMKKVSQADVMSIPFPVRLPLEEQRHIVARLETLDRKVALLRDVQAETGEELNAAVPALLERALSGSL